ncbi:MAG: metallophosphoesterase [Alistipes sp.]|nr:metallophosphoesterase [Alistipes sp.]
MIVGMVATLLLYLGANAYIFIRLLQALSAVPTALRVAFAFLFWIAAIALFVALIMRDVEGCAWLQRALFDVGSVWLVFVLYMTLAVLLMDVAHLIFPTFKYGVWYALSLTLLLLGYGYINYRNPRIETVEIFSEKLECDNLRVVAISDVHLGHGTTRQMLERYVEMLNSLDADVVLIVGDLIDNSIRPVRQAAMDEVLSKIRAPQGVYMALGNHEYISGVDECLDYLSSTPIVVLRDSVAEIGSGVAIIGRDDRMNRRRATTQELVKQVSDGEFTILLDHQPYDIAESERSGVDLHLSGHTHRGQVWPLNWLTDMLYDQSHGLRRWGATHAYVMQGLSLWGPPFRIGTNSEIVVINISSAKNEQ